MNRITTAKFLLNDERAHLEDYLKCSLNEPGIDRVSERDAIAIAMLLRLGMRSGELRALTKQCFNMKTKTLFIKASKGSYDRELPMPDWLIAALLKYMAKIESNILFPICYHSLRKAWVWFRPVNKRMHALRHTFAITIYKKTKDLRLVQLALGHKSINNTMVYLDFVYTTEQMKKILY